MSSFHASSANPYDFRFWVFDFELLATNSLPASTNRNPNSKMAKTWAGLEPANWLTYYNKSRPRWLNPALKIRTTKARKFIEKKQKTVAFLAPLRCHVQGDWRLLCLCKENTSFRRNTLRLPDRCSLRENFL